MLFHPRWLPPPTQTTDVHFLAHPIFRFGGFTWFQHGAYDGPIPSAEVESQVEVSSVVAKATQVDAHPLSLVDFLSKVAKEVPLPLPGTSTTLHGEKDGVSHSGGVVDIWERRILHATSRRPSAQSIGCWRFLVSCRGKQSGEH